jgi:hypothetical protein
LPLFRRLRAATVRRQKTRAALTTAYAAGLRASEAVGLKVGDVDSGSGENPVLAATFFSALASGHFEIPGLRAADGRAGGG